MTGLVRLTITKLNKMKEDKIIAFTGIYGSLIMALNFENKKVKKHINNFSLITFWPS